jgi:hypothetical protein
MDADSYFGMQYRTLFEDELVIVRRNCKQYERLFLMLPKRCANCKFPIDRSLDQREVYEIPLLGQVCDLCGSIYRALTGAHLKRMSYFRDLHIEWKKEQEELKKARERSRGNDEGGLK